MSPWRGFTAAVRPATSNPLLLLAHRGRRHRRRRPLVARGRARWSCWPQVVLAGADCQPVLTRVAAARRRRLGASSLAAVHRRRGQRPAVRRAGAGRRRRRRRPAADRRRPGLPAAGRLARLHAAPGPAGRAAAADDLQRPGEHARATACQLVGLRADRRRLPACSSSRRATRWPAGAARSADRRDRRPDRASAPAPARCAAPPGRSAASATALAVAPPGAHPDPRPPRLRLRAAAAAAATTSGSRTRWPTCVRDLKRGEDIPLVQVTTSDPDPSYLRISVLTRFTDARVELRATATSRRPGSPTADAAAAGRRAEVPRTEYAVRRHGRMPDFDSMLAAHPGAGQPRSSADGDWRYDDDTMDFLAGRRRPDDRGHLDYSMTGCRPRAHGRSAGRRRRAGRRGRTTSSPTCPRTCPQIVARPRRRGHPGPADPLREGGRAAGLVPRVRRLHLRPRTPPTGNGSDALVDFLTEGTGRPHRLLRAVRRRRWP